MTYGTLEYWERQANGLQRESANQRREIETLWGRLVAVETAAANAGVNVNDPELSAHSAELEAITESNLAEGRELEEFRRAVLATLFEAEDAVTKSVHTKEEAFDRIVKGIYRLNRKAIGKSHVAQARELVARRRAALADTARPATLFEVTS